MPKPWQARPQTARSPQSPEGLLRLSQPISPTSRAKPSPPDHAPTTPSLPARHCYQRLNCAKSTVYRARRSYLAATFVFWDRVYNTRKAPTAEQSGMVSVRLVTWAVPSRLVSALPVNDCAQFAAVTCASTTAWRRPIPERCIPAPSTDWPRWRHRSGKANRPSQHQRG